MTMLVAASARVREGRSSESYIQTRLLEVKVFTVSLSLQGGWFLIVFSCLLFLPTRFK